MSDKNIDQKPGDNQPQAPRSISVETVDKGSRPAPYNDEDRQCCGRCKRVVN